MASTSMRENPIRAIWYQISGRMSFNGKYGFLFGAGRFDVDSAARVFLCQLIGCTLS